jgi:hypothetical protein
MEPTAGWYGVNFGEMPRPKRLIAAAAFTVKKALNEKKFAYQFPTQRTAP